MVGLVYLLLVGGAVLPAGSAFESAPLLRNGGFESELVEWLPDATTTERVPDPKAHTGRFSMRGEVTKPNRAKFLVYPVKFDPGKLYKVVLWARSSNRNKLVIWIRVGERRVYITGWRNVPRRWRRYEARFSPPEGGPGRIEIVAPSSFGAPTGVMWLDDVQIFEAPAPPMWNLTGGEGLCDFPMAALDGAGRLYVVWTGFDCAPESRKRFRVIGGRMSLRVAVLDPAQIEGSAENLSTLRPPKALEVPLPSGAYIRDPFVVGLPDGAVLLWSMEVGGNWDVWASRVTREGVSPPVRITEGPATEIKPAGCLDREGRLWVAFEGNEGGWRGIYALSLDPETLRPREPCPRPVRLSSPRTNNYNPSVAAGSDGVWVVWDGFRKPTYHLFGARFDGGRWGPERRLTDSPLVEHHPCLATSPDGTVWMAWELGVVPGYRTTVFSHKEVRVARLDPDGLKAPLNMPESLADWCEFPTLSFDREGRLWLCVRHAIDQHRGWETFLYCYDGEKWTGPIYVVPKQGRSRRAWAIPLPSGGGVVVVSQADTLPGSWGQKNLLQPWESNVLLAFVKAGGFPSPKPPALGDYREVERKDKAKFSEALKGRKLDVHSTPMAFLALRSQFGEDAPRFSIEYRGRRLYLFWGDFHAHSSVSVCNRRGDIRPDDNYAHMRDINRYDFAALTDHGYNIDPYIWTLMGIWARSNCDPGRFLTFLGEEWTSTFEVYTKEHPYGYYGHRNLIFADPYFPKWFNAWDGSTPRQVWDALRKMGANFIHIPHQLADNGNVPVDWNFADEEAQPVAEIFQARGSYEYRGAPRQAGNVVPGDGYFLQEAWARGVVIGVIASPDHGGGLGKAAVFAPELSREAILDAIRERHTYGTTAAKIFVDFRVDGHLMGEKFSRPDPSAPVKIELRAIGANRIARIDIWWNNRIIFTKSPMSREVSLTFTDNRPPAGRAFYYARVVQVDNEIAWTSPVWVVNRSKQRRQVRRWR